MKKFTMLFLFLLSTPTFASGDELVVGIPVVTGIPIAVGIPVENENYNLTHLAIVASIVSNTNSTAHNVDTPNRETKETKQKRKTTDDGSQKYKKQKKAECIQIWDEPEIDPSLERIEIARSEILDKWFKEHQNSMPGAYELLDLCVKTNLPMSELIEWLECIQYAVQHGLEQAEEDLTIHIQSNAFSFGSDSELEEGGDF